MADDKIIIQIELDDGTVKQGFLNIKNQAEDTGKKINSSLGGKDTFKGLETSLLAVGTAIAAIGSVIASGKFLGAAIDSASEAEIAINQLNSALIATGKFSNAASADLQKYASSLEKTSKFSDEAVLSSTSFLATLTKLDTQGLKQATQVSLDLATALRIDLDSATRLVAKATEGNVESLKRYGIEVQKGKTDAESYANFLQRVGVFSGFATRETNTWSGALAQAGNAFDNILEEIGNFIIKSPTLIAIIKVGAQLFAQLSGSISGARGSADIFNSALEITINSLGYLINFLKPVEVLFRALYTTVSVLVTGISAIATGIQATATAVVTLGNAIGLVSDETARKSLQALNDQIKTLEQNANNTADAFSTTASPVLMDSLEQQVLDFNDKVVMARSEIKGLSDDVASVPNAASSQSAPATIPGSSFETPSSNVGQTEQLGPAMPTFEQMGGDTLDAFSLSIQGANVKLQELRDKGVQNFKDLGAQAITSLGVGVGQAFAKFGAALKNGRNALSAFGDAMLSAFGSSLTQLGTGYILQGIAMTFAYDSNGPPLIAAGAALAALGGALGAAGGGGASASAPANAPAGEFGGTPTQDLNQLEQQKPGNQISVVVQGDIMDSTDTGLRIVDLIKQYGDLNGNDTVTA